MALATSSLYLDYNASAPALPEAMAAASAAFESYGNPSSIHAAGRKARALVEDAREAVAAMAGAAPVDVIFTSGGTEANTLALRGLTEATGCHAIFASAAEHPSVLTHVSEENLVSVTADSVLNLEALEQRLAATPAPAIVAVMLANNETGALQPVTDVVAIARKYGALVHCDAVQGPGKIPVNMAALGVDSLSLSAHKFGGLKGAGALVLRAGREVAATLRGGGQERRRRAGTENVPGIAAFGAAARAEAKIRAAMPRVRALRDTLEIALRRTVPAAQIFAQNVGRLGNTISVALPGVASETQLMRLDLAGIEVSAGSACSSGKIAPSHVLLAMGVPPADAKCAIRVSLGWGTTAAETERFAMAWQALASGPAA